MKTNSVIQTVFDKTSGTSRIIKQKCETLVGNKKVFTTIEKNIYEEAPSFYNDGLGGTNVKTLTTDEIRDAFSNYLIGRRIEQRHELIKINDNGRISIPEKPFLLLKEVQKDVVGKSTTVKYSYGTGRRVSRTNNTTYQVEYFDYLTGLKK